MEFICQLFVRPMLLELSGQGLQLFVGLGLFAFLGLQLSDQLVLFLSVLFQLFSIGLLLSC